MLVSDHEVGQDEDQALVPLLDGQSLGSHSESVGDSQDAKATSRGKEEKFMEVFTQLAKEKLEEMMDDLLEAMMEKLRSGQNGRKEPDIEASTSSQAENNEQIKQLDSSKRDTVAAEPGESAFWPFTATKSDDEIRKEEEERMHHFRDPKFDMITELWTPSQRRWLLDIESESETTRQFMHSFAKELAVTICAREDSRPSSDIGQPEPTNMGNPYFTLKLIGKRSYDVCWSLKLFDFLEPHEQRLILVMIRTIFK